jgi:hypothetical protein
VRKHQAKITAQAKAICNIFKLEHEHGESNINKCYDNAASDSCIVPQLKLYQKLHKPGQTQSYLKTVRNIVLLNA